MYDGTTKMAKKNPKEVTVGIEGKHPEKVKNDETRRKKDEGEGKVVDSSSNAGCTKQA